MRNLFFIAISCLLLTSCTDNKQYTINGTFAYPDYEGKSVYLYNDKEMQSLIDSAKVENNKFLFSGVAPDSVQVAFFSYAKRMAPIMLVLEKGDLSLTIDTTFFGYNLKGTPLNDEYQIYKDSFQLLMTDSFRFGKEMEAAFQNSDITENEKQEWKLKTDSVLNDIEDVVFRFISKNANNTLGEHVFLKDTYFMNHKKTEKLIPLFRPHFDGVDPELKARLIAEENTSEGKAYTDVKGYDITGKEISFSDFVGRGNVVLIDYWASWCGPCIADLPHLKDFYNKNKDKGLIVLGVSLDNDKDAWLKATEKHGIEWPQLSNLKGYDDLAAKTYAIRGIPHTILIDKNGVIAGRNLKGAVLQNKFDELIK